LPFALTALLSHDCAPAAPTAKQVISTARIMRWVFYLFEDGAYFSPRGCGLKDHQLNL
jgi:hypothetical protein